MPVRPIVAIFTLVLLAGCGSSAGGGSPTATAPTSGNSALAPGGQNHVHAILVDASRPADLYLGSHYHLYRSSDGGHVWRPLIAQMMYAMVRDDRNPRVMYGLTLQSGLLKSTDAGTHWRKIGATVPRGKVIGLLWEPHTRALLAYGIGVYRSVDGGSTWKHLIPSQYVTAAALGATRTLYAGGYTGLLISNDGGIHWHNATGLTPEPVFQVVASGPTAYAVTPTKLARTTNGGASWTTLRSAPQGIEYAGIAPSKPTEIIVHTQAGGFHVSDDGGRTWQSANTGIHDTNFTSSTVQFAPSNPRVAYTGAWGVHLYVSHDGGHSWKLTASLPK